MTLLRLDRVAVHIARANGSGSDPAPDGTHVWLDVPGGPFEFNHFVVHGGHLEPVGAAGAGSAQLDSRWAYWSVWGASELSVGRSFAKVAGFGWPLPARIRERRLVLPNTRPLEVRYFNLTSRPDVTAHHAGAVSYFGDLHIEVTFVPQAVPAGTRLPVQLVQGGPRGARFYDLSFAEPDMPFIVTNPDLGSAPWRPTGALAHVLACYWVDDFTGMSAALGNAWPKLRGGVPVSLGEHFSAPPCAYFMMRGRTPPAVSATNRVAHEMVHCLLQDAGLGRAVLDASPDWATAVRSHLASLHLEGPVGPDAERSAPGARLYAQLFNTPHADASSGAENNLMGTSGGALLLPWQVALIRASEQIGDGP